ncbi:MAG: hypothetical protein OEW62_01015 [Candidatus Bathyarchaeota archaeon]|nr:hypothetical protein [Candidatus Bathyarchaeota archaeon]MDH5595105.1 hypothetical protein [Candidatus Bathyarchaeota archaeon]
MTGLFFIVLARDRKHVDDKIRELEALGVPYRIVCGERLNHPNVVYRAPKGKYDAINFSLKLIPKDVDIVVLNDVDTEIYNFEAALCYLENKKVALVFAKDVVRSGPQVLFHQLLFSILRILPILANGDLMVIRRNVLERIYLLPCKAEDAYILFRVLELGYNAIFSEECYVETKKTENEKEEEMYKRRTVTGIYQALSYTHPPPLIRLFYALLPISSPLLLVSGKKGYFWMKGILSGFMEYLRGDRGGAWQNA